MHPQVKIEVVKLRPGTPEHERSVALAHLTPEQIAAQQQETRFGMVPSFPRGRPLRFWVDWWGGYSYEITAPDGSVHPVSVEPWREEDHDTTIIAITFKYADPARVTTKPHDH